MELDRKYIVLLVIVVAALLMGPMVGHKDPVSNTVVTITVDGKTKDTIEFSSLKLDDFRAPADGIGQKGVKTFNGVDFLEMFTARKVKYNEASEIKVVAYDGKTAVFKPEEIAEGGKVYLITAIEGEKIDGYDAGCNGLQVLVVNDGTQRCIKYVSRIELTN